GQVEGTVLRNGRPAVGARLRLVRTDSGERFGVGMPQQRTDQDGKFRFDRVEAGDYALLVHGDGAHARTVVDRSAISVTANATTEAHRDYSTCSVRGTVRATDGALLDGTLYVLPDASETPADVRRYARENPVFRVTVRGGEFATDDVRAGNCLLLFERSGAEPTTWTRTLVVGENRIDLTP
ncbi:MAG: carboxypeptidase regulatory-like domain-containing protein, partial [Planctomycetes bacterium]|nr:carboxypeptidase regulatory-like domain-containing protein [Planctomycetota bacterium]